jgi:hypothetical protein
VSARAPWVRIPPPPYLEDLHRVSYSTISRQNYFNHRYKATFERFKKLSLVIVLHKRSVRGNLFTGGFTVGFVKNYWGIEFDLQVDLKLEE